MKHILAIIIFTVTIMHSISSFALAPSSPATINLQRNRYTIDYPKGWEARYGNKGEVVFTHPIANTKLSLMINIQTIDTRAGGGKYISVKDLMDDFLIQVPMHTQDARLFDRKPFILSEPDGSKISGEQIMVTFKENKQAYKQWQIMLMSEDGILFQAFAYRAPAQYYDENLPTAVTMLATWVLK